MAWETRKGNGRYYTRSRRVDGRVVREYFGSGITGELAAMLHALKREERKEELAACREERRQAKAQESALVEYYSAVDRALAAVLLTAGYHKHKGQWRRKRDTKEEGNGPGEP